jgi:hypothetical protein
LRGSGVSLGFPLGLPDPDALTDGDAVAEGVGEGDEAGAVGVGTGGFTQQIGFAGFLVRIGLAFRGGLGTTTAGVGSTGVVLIITGAGFPGVRSTGIRGARGDRPIPVSAVAGGSVPAAAGPSSRNGTSPFTTTR